MESRLPHAHRYREPGRAGLLFASGEPKCAAVDRSAALTCFRDGIPILLDRCSRNASCFALPVSATARGAQGENMNGHLVVGLAAVTLAGILNGSFAAPMKRMSAWRWENSWLWFAFSGLLIFPWIINFATIPHVVDVYLGASASTLSKVVLFGLLWGTGATLFGLGINRVGMALGFALILGITASFGSVLPLAILHPQELLAKRGLLLIAATVVMVVGLYLLAIAGRVREHDLGADGGPRSGFAAGLIICVFSGVFSSMLNFSFVFGDELRTRALQSGATTAMAANPVWTLTVSGGFVVNFLYCVYLLNKNQTWGLFRAGDPAIYWPLALTTGASWFGGIVFYGMGAAALGSLGAIAAWPVFMTLDILAGLFWGAISGEWKGASRRAIAFCWVGVAVLLFAIAIISAGNAA
jgi:L-rhamnose-H+ transport protein